MKVKNPMPRSPIARLDPRRSAAGQLAIGAAFPRRLACRAAIALGLMVGAAGLDEARLNVVTTTPDLAALAAVVGGNDVSVLSLAKPTEDPHYVDARPSHILKLNAAQLLIEGGADLEAGWLGSLVEGARNTRLRPGSPGRLIASEGVALLDIPATLDRARGDVHAAGNPHFLMDPLNAKIVARHVAASFCELDPPRCASYRGNLEAFERAVDSRVEVWQTLLAPCRGMRIVTYHATLRYFAARFGLVSDTFLEPKPGIPPSPPHLAEVIEKMTAQKIRAILVEPYHQRKVAETVAGHTGASVVDVAQFPGGLPGTEGDYIALMDANVRAVAGALAPGR
jgi:ABC-type Zn uptake system ZnuABC Zn-binding protein ZnuA